MNIEDVNHLQSSRKVHKKEELDEDSEIFNFPFHPYDIQLDLMKVAYDTYENSKFAILESPTGTGKSLSLICSSLTWLKNFQIKEKVKLEVSKERLTEKIELLKKEEETSGDWLSIQTKRQDLNKELNDVDRQLDRIIKFEQRSETRRHAKLHDLPILECQLNEPSRNQMAKAKCHDDSSIVAQLINSEEDKVEPEDEDIEKKLKESVEADHIKPKIYYASRTHSQLSQFINEIKRTKFADINKGIPVKVAPLASRANLCVNPEVLKLKDPNAINERCVELQRESKHEKRCSYVKAKQVHMLKEDILSSVQDIEDIVIRGKVLGSCPYYASRISIPEAEVVVLPYNNLLHHETRKASSFDLKESIVIIDEAHNILETICSIHSAAISGRQLIGSHSILSRYYKRYHSRMAPKNAEVIRLIVECITSLIRYLDDPLKHIMNYDCPMKINLDDSITATKEMDEKKQTVDLKYAKSKHEEMMTEVTKFNGIANIERFNVFKLIDFFNRSQLARKLLGFHKQDCSLDLTIELSEMKRESSTISTENCKDNMPVKKKRKMLTNQSNYTAERDKKDNTLNQTNLEFLKISNPEIGKSENLSSYPIYTLIEFLKSLTNLAQDGKVMTDYVNNDIQQSFLKFLLLNPSSQFKQMTQEARSIVLAGGTMQPFEEFFDLLFNPLGIERSRLTLFSCNHVIEADQLYVATLTHGSTGKPLELSYKTRNCMDTIDELGRTLMNITNVVPGGIVCFLPSYDYEQLCFKRWNQIGVISKIETKTKQVFREPKQTSHLKTVLEEYSRVIEKGKSCGRGALLLCVVGGKMSEGINFNDDLGRCVVMFGLPYANIKSGELQQKMSYYDRTCKRNGSNQNCLSSGQQYYENLCIKGINQSIGRAIRHKNDYASIILLDKRYSSKTLIRNGLSGWMRNSIVDYERFGPMFQQLKLFFEKRKAACAC